MSEAAALNANTNSDDYWTQQYSTAETQSEPHLNVDAIEGITPLDTQFGVADLKTVPDELYGPLFGKPVPTETELALACGDPTGVQPLHTYAILDGAKVAGLPELLAASGLEHRCLFKGKAYDDLKDVAPWIIQLEEGNGFTRNLFTRSDALWHLWGTDPGIYIRSRVTLDQMWRHFRKFTKVYTSDAKWLYFRFWEPEILGDYLTIQSGSQKVHNRFFQEASSIIVLASGSCSIFSSKLVNEDSRMVVGLNRLDDDCRAALRTSYLRKTSKHILKKVQKMFHEQLRERQYEELFEITLHCLTRMAQYGFHSERNLEYIVAWELFYGPVLEERDSTGILRQICEETAPEFQRFSSFKKRMRVIEAKPSEQLRDY